jgi:hypothetical protein
METKGTVMTSSTAVGLGLSILGAFAACTGPTGRTGPAGATGPTGPAGQSPDAGSGSDDYLGAIDLPGATAYPLSLASDATGTVYVSGLFGEVDRLNYTAVETVIPEVGSAGTFSPNIMIDQTKHILYACNDAFTPVSGDPYANPIGTLYAYDLQNLSGTPTTYALPTQGKNSGAPGSLCQDIAVDASGNVFITDSFYETIDELPTGGSAISTWYGPDPKLGATSKTLPPFGAHGLAVVGSNLYVDNFNTSQLYRIGIVGGAPDSAGLVTETVSPAITNPERLVALDGQNLLVAEDVWCQPGRLTQLTQSGSSQDSWGSTVLKSDLQGAGSVTVANGSYYATDSQACGILTQLAGGPKANPPALPFWIDRIEVQ